MGEGVEVRGGEDEFSLASLITSLNSTGRMLANSSQSFPVLIGITSPFRATRISHLTTPKCLRLHSEIVSRRLRYGAVGLPP